MQNGRRTAREQDLLAAADIARMVGVKETTVWRWCREGKLPCLKVGKHWRIRREVLEDFLKQSERPTTLPKRLDSFLKVPDNVLAIAQNLDILRRLDAAFFQVGEARGGLLVKFYGGEKDPEEELRARLEQNGLEVGRLEREGRLLMRPEGDSLDGREEALGRVIEQEAEKGRTVWASFNWAQEADLETALEQQERLNELVDTRQLVVKTATLQEVIDDWPAATLRRAQTSHSGNILASEDRLLLSRATPMPST